MLFCADPAVDQWITARHIACDPQPGKNECED
jgi:hypothetical protein